MSPLEKNENNAILSYLVWKAYTLQVYDWNIVDSSFVLSRLILR